MEDYKEENKKSYNTYAEELNIKFEEHFHKYSKDKADEYIKHLKGKKILDLGSGSGNHAIYFKERGFDVLCFDFSTSMLAICKKKGLDTQQGDIEELNFPKESFDGVWAYASLLHVPKNNMDKILRDIKNILKPHGILQISLKEGTGEAIEESDKYPGTRKHFSYYTEEEIKGMVARHFTILKFWRTKGKNAPFIHLLMKK